MLPRRLQSNSGQALLLVLLSMAVILTVALSILARSITDVVVTTGEEESLRAFSAAEAGVERALIIGSDIGLTSLGNAQFSVNVSGFASGSKEFAYPIKILSGESIVAWFVAHDVNGDPICDASYPCFTGDTIKICWGKPGESSVSATTPAIEIIVFYAETPGVYSSVKIARATYDPNPGRRISNNFSAEDVGTCTLGEEDFEFQKTIDLAALGIPAASYGSQNGLQFARIRIFYNSIATQPIGLGVNFAGNSVLPAQGLKIESSGSSGESNRKVEVFQSFEETPGIFETAIFSPGGIVK